MRRKMVVRNRLILAGAQAGIPALPLKSAGVVTEPCSPAGLRPIANVDLLVSTRKHAATAGILTPRRGLRSGLWASRNPHGRRLRHTRYRGLDMDRHTSGPFTRRANHGTSRGCAD